MLTFAIRAVRAVEHAMTPMLALDLAIEAPQRPIRSAMLHCQILIEPIARMYTDEARARLTDLFGTNTTPPRSILWTHASVVATTATTTELALPCPIDAAHAAAKYFDAVRDGALPIVVQFSGTAFYEDADGRLQAAPIPRDREARTAIPVEIWRATIAHYYPTALPVAIERTTLDRLHAYRRERGLPTIDRAIEELLA